MASEASTLGTSTADLKAAQASDERQQLDTLSYEALHDESSN